jgi:hypothetical protein
MLATLEQEITKVDRQLKEEREVVESDRKATMDRFLGGLSNPQLQTIRYDLQAVLMNDEQTAWAYIRQDGPVRDVSNSQPTWWKCCDGAQQKVTEADVLNDDNVVLFLIYTRYEEGSSVDDMEADQKGEEEKTESSPSQEMESHKPSKTIRLDTVLNWWTNTPLVVSRD